MSESSHDGVQSCTESMSARDCIRGVAETLREPRSINWISEQADAAWRRPTRNSRILSTWASCAASRLARRRATSWTNTHLLFKEIHTLIEENTREELRNELAVITEEIEALQATCDVETWEDLEQSLADGDLASAELHQRRDVITRGGNLEDHRLIKHALALYPDIEAACEQRINVADRAIR